MTKLTQKVLEAIRPDQAGTIIRDEGNLSGRIRAGASGGVSVYFSYRYRFDGRLKDFSCGTWPADSLAQIRANRNVARGQIAKGEDPAAQKKLAKHKAQDEIKAQLAELERKQAENLTLGDLFRAWLADGVRRKDGNAELQRSFKADVLPKVGNKKIRELTEHDLRGVLRAMVGRGVNRASVVMRNNLTQMFGWAEKRQPWRKLLADGNPMDLIEIEKIVSQDYDLNNERDRVLSFDEIRELYDIFKRTEGKHDAAPKGKRYSVARPVEKTTQCALWIMLSTLCRVGELSMARWAHVNFETAEWYIPKENVKGNLSDLTVYLSEFALQRFRELHDETGESDWCFPAKNKDDRHVCVKSMSKQIGDRQSMFKKGKDGNPRKPMKGRRHDNTLVLANGENGAWTPHDLRRTGATMMQALGIPLDIIDRCQNHVLHGSRVRRHYLHHEYADEKRAAWKALGEKLSSIFRCDNVITLPFAHSEPAYVAALLA